MDTSTRVIDSFSEPSSTKPSSTNVFQKNHRPYFANHRPYFSPLRGDFTSKNFFAASRRFYIQDSLISNRKLLLLLLRARAARNFCILESVFAIFALIFSTSGVSKERSVMSRISSERPHILVDDGLVDDGAFLTTPIGDGTT